MNWHKHKVAITIIVLMIAVVGAYQYANYRLVVQRMPNELRVTGIEYRLEENWGSVLLPLPGDNETGIVVYGIDKVVARQIAAEGVAFFMRKEHIEARTGHQSSHELWRETPIIRDNLWGDSRGTTIKKGSILEYLDRYGFDIPVDKAVVTMIDDAISKPGSFYSHGRLGLVIVIPSQSKAVYAYAG